MTDTINGAMDALMTLAVEKVKPRVGEIITTPLHVTRYQPRQPNHPALWHEARPSLAVAADTAHERVRLFVAVMLAVNHGDQDQAPELIEQILDVALDVYPAALAERGSLGVHAARMVSVEQPTPTNVNGVSLLTAGVVLRIDLHRRLGQL